MKKRTFIKTAAMAAVALSGNYALAQAKPFKVGLLLPMTGPFASTGRQIENGVRLYMAQFGDKVAGRTVELVIKMTPVSLTSPSAWHRSW